MLAMFAGVLKEQLGFRLDPELTADRCWDASAGEINPRSSS